MDNFGLTDRESGELIALESVEVTASICGLLTKTTLTQKYFNERKENVELTYTFPLPTSGVLLSLSVRIGEKTFSGEVIPRQQAEVKYEEAISAGDSAFRLQEIRPGVYSVSLGNVLAREAIEISLIYAETLTWNGKSIRYRLPTAIAPRYGAPVGFQPWQAPETHVGAEYPLSLSIRISGQLAAASIECPSHVIRSKHEQNAILVTLAPGAFMDRDFVLELTDSDVTSLGVSASACDTNVAMLTLLTPEVAREKMPPRDIVIVLDCSGSMKGDSFRHAKQGVKLSLGSLSATERFAVIGFGSGTEQFSDELLPANRKNIDFAWQFVDQLGDLGGTELAKALDLALDYATDRGMDILLLTDGEVWKTGDAIERACKKRVRIFTIGIGSAVAEDTVRMLSDKTGGACELVTPREGMSLVIFRHFSRMRQPKIECLEVAWAQKPLWEYLPGKGCYAGDAYTVFAAFENPLSEPATVRFGFGSENTETISVPLMSSGNDADAIVRIAACNRLNNLTGSDQLNWAVRYQLVSEQTDYIITVERSADEKPADLPGLQVVPQMLAAGWGGVSSIHASPPLLFSRRSVSTSYAQLDDTPCVIRKARKLSFDECDDFVLFTPYSLFFDNLIQQANRRIFNSIPATKTELIKIGLPQELSELFDALVVEGNDELTVIIALYKAISSHAGSAKVGRKYQKKISALSGNQVIDTKLIDRIVSVLRSLPQPSGSEASGAIDRYDIPAFLRRQAD